MMSCMMTPRTMSPGDQLNILPVDGVYYEYNYGESLTEIANKFNTSIEAIVEWPGNEDAVRTINSKQLGIGKDRWLIIPKGSRDAVSIGILSFPVFPPSYAIGDYCGPVSERAISDGNFVWPTTESSIVGFDWNPPLHNGIDIGGEERDSVFAVGSGIVTFSGWNNYGFGFSIVIDHGGGIQTAYGHLYNVSVVCSQSVEQGQVIGLLGNTGDSPRPQLHFEVAQNGTKVNPWFYVSP